MGNKRYETICVIRRTPLGPGERCSSFKDAKEKAQFKFRIGGCNLEVYEPHHSGLTIIRRGYEDGKVVHKNEVHIPAEDCKLVKKLIDLHYNNR